MVKGDPKLHDEGNLEVDCHESPLLIIFYNVTLKAPPTRKYDKFSRTQAPRNNHLLTPLRGVTTAANMGEGCYAGA